MSKIIDDALAIIDNSDFNSLPFEERKRMCKYITEQQILTLYQVIKKDSHLTTKAWREKQLNWLGNVVSSYKSEYRTEASGKASFDCSAPDCLDCERNDECNGLFDEASE